MPTIVTAGAATAGSYGWAINGPDPYSYDALLVAGGGGGGYNRGGGGGAGGVAYYGSLSTNHGSTYSYSVGSGGAGATTGAAGSNGGNTTYSIFTAIGGGGGGSSTTIQGSSGGSGGGIGVGGTNATFTASMSGTVLTVTAVTSGTISVGDYLDTSIVPYNPNTIQEGTYIVSQASGTTGGVGTYNVSLPNTIGSGTFYTVPNGGAGTVGQGNSGGYASYPITSASSGSGGGGASSVGRRGFRGYFVHYSTGGSGLITSMHPLFAAFGGGGGGGGYSLGVSAASYGYGGIGGGGWGGSPANQTMSGGTGSQSGTTLTVTAVGSTGVGSMTGSISGTTLTYTTNLGGSGPIIGMTITGTGVAAGTVITGILTGTGGTGSTFSLNKSSSVSGITLTMGWGGFLPGSGWTGTTITAETVVAQLSATNAASLTTTATGITGANYITLASTTGLVPGMFVQPITGIPTGTYVNAIYGTTVELTNALTGNLTAASINFYPPGFTGTYQMSTSQSGTAQALTNNAGQAVAGKAGTQYTGGGGGGGGGNLGVGGRGGDGCVIIRYPSMFTQPTITPTTGTYTVTTSGIYNIYLLTGSGTVKWNQ